MTVTSHEFRLFALLVPTLPGLYPRKYAIFECADVTPIAAAMASTLVWFQRELDGEKPAVTQGFRFTNIFVSCCVVVSK